MSQTLRFTVVPLVAATLLRVVIASAAEPANTLPKQGSPGPHGSVKELHDEFLNKWFWQEGAQPKTAQQVVELLTTVNSRNSNFLLNVGPNERGRFEEGSVKVLTEVGRLREQEEGDTRAK